MIKKDDRSLLYSSKENVIPEDMSPLKIGTTGKWENRTFEIVGRIRYVSGSRYSNQWVISMEDGTFNWLCEGYGFYSILKKDSLSKIPANFVKIKRAGESFKSLNNAIFFVDNIANNETYFCEGELPEEVFFSKKFISIESTNSKQEVNIVDVYSKTDYQFYSGKIVDFHLMNFNNLRDLHGWI